MHRHGVRPVNTDPAGQPLSLAECRVLVVEDNPPTCQLIKAFLSVLGIEHVFFAGDGVEGLERVPAVAPDLIILDVMMPRMDGIEFLKRLRADPDWATTPVLVQTALDSKQDRTRIYTAGANDMLTKPLNHNEFVVRVRTHLENRLLVRSHLHRIRLSAEVGTARRMQMALLPPEKLLEEIELHQGVRIQSHFETCSELGGDFWGVHRHRAEDPTFGLFSVDFSGHGLGAALNTFRLHTLMNNFRPTGDDPAEYLSMLNQQLVGLLPRGQFATMVYILADVAAGTLTYSGAGAPPPLVGDPKTGTVERLDASGIPLGMVREAQYENRQADFPAGGVLFLYSDALFETGRRDGAEFGVDDVPELFRQSLFAETDPLNHMVTDFRAKVIKSLDDDLTLVTAIRCR